MQQQLYELLNSDPSQLVGNNSLQQFIYNNQLSNLDYIHYASKYVAEGRYDIVELLLGFWPGTSELDDAYYSYFHWFIQMHDDPSWLPDANEVLNLANRCPLKNGLVIYAVRNLYNAITREIHQFENNCEGTSQFKGSSTTSPQGFIRLHPRKETKTIQQVTKPIVLYPNPAKGIVKVNGANIAAISIYDVMGKTVVTGNYNKATTFTIDISKLQKGIYFVRIINADKTSKIEKLIVE